jgi:thiamine monophosphate kinase
MGAEIDSHALPVAAGATLDDALWGGDDYELLVTAPKALPGFEVIGVVSDNLGIRLDGREVLLSDTTSRGYDHFRS